MIKLEKPLVVFDLETTGTNTKVDRVTQIAGAVYTPRAGGNPTASPFDFYVNPGVRIPAELEELTGITNDFVKDKPPFSAIARQIVEIFSGCDIGGFAVEKFDLPMLLAELDRCGTGLNLAGVEVVDAQKIYHQQEQRRLENALFLYCDRKFDEGEWHRANHDAAATFEILVGQARFYGQRKAEPGPMTIREMIALGVDDSGRFCDPDGKFEWRDGEPAFRFGKHKGRTLRDVVEKDAGYVSWLLYKADDFKGEARRIVLDAESGLHRRKPAAVAS